MTFTATDEIVKLAYDIADGWYQDSPIDWEDLYDRLDGARLADGTTLDLGEDLRAPELLKLKRAVQRMRRESQ